MTPLSFVFGNTIAIYHQESKSVAFHDSENGKEIGHTYDVESCRSGEDKFVAQSGDKFLIFK